MSLYAEVETYLGETYYQCQEHYQMSLQMSSGRIKRLLIPPQTATDASYCDQCVMKTLGRIGADRIDDPGVPLGEPK